MARQILFLDKAGQPLRWGSYEDAMKDYATGDVVWTLGDEDYKVFRGGTNAATGIPTVIHCPPIIAIKGESGKKQYKRETLTNSKLFARDRWACAYCGTVLPEAKLTRDHVVPVSRGGKDIWENVVTACGPCNNYKDDYLLHEVGMELRYVPYVPTAADMMFMDSRGILPCQAEYLLPFCSDRARLAYEGSPNQSGPAVKKLEEATVAATAPRQKRKS